MCFIPFYSFLSKKTFSPFILRLLLGCASVCAVVVFHSRSRSSFLIHFVCKLCELKSVRCVCAGENILMLSTACTYITKVERCRVKSSAAIAVAAAAVVLKYLLRLPAEKRMCSRRVEGKFKIILYTS